MRLPPLPRHSHKAKGPWPDSHIPGAGRGQLPQAALCSQTTLLLLRHPSWTVPRLCIRWMGGGGRPAGALPHPAVPAPCPLP